MLDSFVTKLSRGVDLTNGDKVLLERLSAQKHRAAARRDIVSATDKPRSIPLILKGWACRYQLLEDGKRQIVTLYLPGDLCEPFGVLPRFMDYPLGALTDVVYAPVALNTIQSLARESPCISTALWWDLLVASAIEREHIVSLGRRSASQRLGHLFCELQLRTAMIGLYNSNSYDLPLTQADLADLAGLTSVHVNRSLQDLRKAGLISLRNRRLTIHHLAELRDRFSFDPSYLHLHERATTSATRPTFNGGGESLIQ